MINGKAAGNDGIVGEMFKISKYVLIPHLFILFNNNYSHEVVFTRMDGVRQLYAHCIRMALWMKLGIIEVYHYCHKKSKLVIKKYSTIDQIFSLQALCQKHITKKNGRFYVLFIDFTKAVDTIPYNLLWYKLIKSGVHGKLLKVLDSIYADLKSCARTHSGLTEYFQCTDVYVCRRYCLWYGDCVSDAKNIKCAGKIL